MGNVSIFVACFFIPGIFIYMMTRPMIQLKDSIFEAQYGELYTGLKTDSKWTVSYYLVFILRRLAFLALAFYAY